MNAGSFNARRIPSFENQLCTMPIMIGSGVQTGAFGVSPSTHTPQPLNPCGLYSSVSPLYVNAKSLSRENLDSILAQIFVLRAAEQLLKCPRQPMNQTFC